MNGVSPTTSPRKVSLIRAPLMPVAAAVACGIASGRFAPLPTGFYVVCGIAAMVAAVLAFRRPHLQLATAGAIIAAAGALAAVHVRLAYFAAAENHVVTYTDESPMPASLRGRIVTAPQVIEADDVMGYHRQPHTSFILQAGGVRTTPRGGPAWVNVCGLVRVRVDEPAWKLQAGQQVELVGWMGRFRGPANPGQYDFAAAARNSGVLVRMNVPAADGAIILAGADQSPLAKAYWHVRATARQHLAGCGDVSSGRLVNALVLGERHSALRTLSRTMVRAGIAHFLSISGLHLGVFLGFVYLLLRVTTLSPRRSAAAVLIVLAAYMLLAEPRAPLLRSAVMAAALCLAVIFQRRHSALNALAAAAILLLAIDPMRLFSAGFQLSFAIVIGLILLHRPVRNRLFGRWLRRRGLVVFRGEQRLGRWLYFTAGDRLMDLITMLLTCYLVAAPLVAYHFGLFSPYGPLLSFLLFPLILAVLVPGYISIALAWPMPNLSAAIGRLAGGAAEKLTGTVESLQDLPALSLELRPVGFWWVGLCYLVLGIVVIHRRCRLGRALAVVALAGLVAATVHTQRRSAAPAAAELNVLAVGAGQCAVLRTPAGATYLFDAGTRSGYDAGRQVLKPFLRAMRLPGPREAFISHANTDHYNMLPGMVGLAGPGRVYLNDYFPGPERGGPSYHTACRFMQILAERKVQIVRLQAGMRLSLDERTEVEVLWPPAEIRDDLTVNDTSLVLRICCDGESVLLTGDLDDVGQAELTKRGGRIRADVLVAPHHGGWERTLPEFVRAVGAETIIVSSSRDLRVPIGAGPAAKRFYTELRTHRRYYCTARN
ncbi:MAG: ComEC/Rec2 family competence protein, partial [Planctomycetota bacterium]|nr:ComEC/Rec2 family competence protein [Planctomycetota bacterium]